MIEFELVNPLAKSIQKRLFPLERFITEPLREELAVDSEDFIRQSLAEICPLAHLQVVDDEQCSYPFYDPRDRVLYIQSSILHSPTPANLAQIAHVLCHIDQYQRGDRSLRLLQVLYKMHAGADRLLSRLFAPVIAIMAIFLTVIFISNRLPDNLFMLWVVLLAAFLLTCISFILLFLTTRIISLAWFPFLMKVELQASAEAIRLLRNSGCLHDKDITTLEKHLRPFLSQYANTRMNDEPCVRYLNRE
jgi:Zn-dependent membrane protease YugP